MRALSPLLAGGLALALALAPGTGTGASSSSPWFPLEDGREYHFRLKRNRSMKIGESVRTRDHFVGETVISVLPERKGETDGTAGSGEVRVRVVDVERSPRLFGDQRPIRRRERFVYSVRDGSVHLHTHTEEGATHEFQPPLLFLDAPLQPGRRWEMGTFHSGGLDIQVAAEVTGREAVPDAPDDSQSALRVRYTGSVSGSMEGESGEHSVRQGSYERDLWLVRGEGPVREVVEIELELRSPGGETVHVSETLKRTRRTDANAEEAPPSEH